MKGLQLFLWNYEDGSDFCVYDGVTQVISAVGVVPAKEGVFVKDIHYLLVLCTPVEISILAIQFPNNNINSQISLIPSSVP